MAVDANPLANLISKFGTYRKIKASEAIFKRSEKFVILNDVQLRFELTEHIKDVYYIFLCQNWYFIFRKNQIILISICILAKADDAYFD